MSVSTKTERVVQVPDLNSGEGVAKDRRADEVVSTAFEEVKITQQAAIARDVR